MFSDEGLSLIKRVSIAVVLGGAVLLVGCDNPQRTVASLRKEIAEFKTTPTEKTRAKIEENFAKLDRQIAEWQKRGDPSADELRNQFVSLRSEYQAAKISKAVQDTRSAIEGFGQALKETARSVEEAFKNADTNSE
jgi:Sec-independent protein translocase protein TatA